MTTQTPGGIPDPRHIANGWTIPTENYSDQPYIVRTGDGAWLCTVTTGGGREGQAGQHVVSMRSADLGRSWSPPVALEPADGPEASYSVLLAAPGGRVFCFYNHNTDNVREVIGDDPPFAGGKCRRVDSLGHFVFRYSDDHGRSWSPRRCPIPVREFAIDRENAYGGKLRFFWNVGKPFIHEGAACVPLHKVGGFGDGFFTRSEGVLLRSPDLLALADPARATWQTLPDGDAGLRTPPGGGPIAEEQSFVALSDGSLYCVYRSIDGFPVCTHSRDGGRTWSAPEYQRYADGRVMKHPRAANFIWRCANGKYLYWFHNNGGRWVSEGANAGSFGYPYQNRNPAWLCGGVEADSPAGRVIRWSQPEIVLYDDDPLIRMSYPDLIEEAGRLFITETQKFRARVHELDRSLAEAMWGQFDAAPPVRRGLLLELADPMPAEAAMPALPRFVERDMGRFDHGARPTRQGFSIELLLRAGSLAAGQVVLDWRRDDGPGGCLRTTGRGTLELLLSDGQTVASWDCDPGALSPSGRHHVVAAVDGGPGIITFVVDGRLCDGGRSRQFGWGRFSPHLAHANGSDRLRIAPSFDGAVERLRLFGRALRTSEAVGNCKACDR
ncbi:MAG: hypothetical protein BIFFINMI_03662 [Phycisphaerae bacterium]|nr:hypothetical protein [Phycisphaerae bacterium]